MTAAIIIISAEWVKSLWVQFATSFLPQTLMFIFIVIIPKITDCLPWDETGQGTELSGKKQKQKKPMLARASLLLLWWKKKKALPCLVPPNLVPGDLLTGVNCSLELHKWEGQRQILGFLSEREQRNWARSLMHREGQLSIFLFLLSNYHTPTVEEGLKYMWLGLEVQCDGTQPPSFEWWKYTVWVSVLGQFEWETSLSGLRYLNTWLLVRRSVWGVLGGTALMVLQKRVTGSDLWECKSHFVLAKYLFISH